MISTLSRFRREVSGAVVGCGVALLASAALRAATSDRAWLVGLMLLGVAVLVLGGFAVLLRHTSEPEPVPSAPPEVLGLVKSHRPARPGPRTPLHEVVRHPVREMPVVRADCEVTTVRLPSHAEVTAYLDQVRADQTVVLPVAGGRRSL